MSTGRRELGNSKKINITKVLIVIVLMILVVVGIYFLVKKKGCETETVDNSKKMVEEISEEKNKSIEEIVAEFGGEVKEEIKSDTYYITKDGKDYTAYSDGEIAEGNIALWSGTSKEPPKDEAGNINIYTAEELKWIADQVINGEKNFSGVTITLRNTIDLGARKNEDGSWSGPTWTPIVGFLDELPKKEGDENSNNSEGDTEIPIEDDSVEVTQENLKRFAGVFNGNGNSIRGMYIESDKRYQGLFGYQSGTIQDLTIKSSSIKGETGVGAIVGLNAGAIVECKLQNVEVKGKEKIGGFAGISMANSNIENCIVNDNSCIVNGEKYVAGIAGYVNNNATIIGSSNKVNVLGKDYVGGIAGIIFYGSTIKNCSNLSINVVGDNYVGGIAGYSGAQIENSYNQDNQSSTGVVKSVSGKNYVGGIAGLNYLTGNITNSYNMGVIETGEDNCGGIVGLNNASVSNCYNSGVINASNCDGIKIGGICGQNISESFINTSYNIGTIKAKKTAEGIVGADFGTTSNCFYLNTSITVSNTENKEGAKTESELKSVILENLSDAYKEDIENKNNGYPVLLWQ